MSFQLKTVQFGNAARQEQLGNPEVTSNPFVNQGDSYELGSPLSRQEMKWKLPLIAISDPPDRPEREGRGVSVEIKGHYEGPKFDGKVKVDVSGCSLNPDRAEKDSEKNSDKEPRGATRDW